MSSVQSYLVLARKYRPACFADMVGQEVLVQTLKHAFTQKRLGHAFLLSGVRGVGKTTTARILAKCLNCLEHDHPTISPCGKCDSCVQIAAGKHIDVIEMDAASHTGIDDIREITQNVQYKPLIARYKVYIIDEVHMLSKAAFNGLLKTLEEPPEHCKFIFATTELHKIPVTIQSRCQRYDLCRVTHENLAAYLKKICEAEKVIAQDEALEAIAKAAEGSVRDSLSLLDQAISYCQGDLKSEQIQSMLGLTGFADIASLFEYLIKAQVKELLEHLKTLFLKGADAKNILAEILDLIAAITRYKITQQPDIIYHSGLHNTFLQSNAEKLSVPALTRLWQSGMLAYKEITIAPDIGRAVEMAFIRMSYANMLPLNDEIIDALKKKVQ